LPDFLIEAVGVGGRVGHDADCGPDAVIVEDGIPPVATILPQNSSCSN